MTARSFWRQVLDAVTHSGPAYRIGETPAEVERRVREQVARDIEAVVIGRDGATEDACRAVLRHAAGIARAGIGPVPLPVQFKEQP